MHSYRDGERARAIKEEEASAAVAEEGKDGEVGQAREREKKRERREKVKGSESLLGPTSKERGRLAIGGSGSTETCIECSVNSHYIHTCMVHTTLHQSSHLPRILNTEKE